MIESYSVLDKKSTPTNNNPQRLLRRLSIKKPRINVIRDKKLRKILVAFINFFEFLFNQRRVTPIFAG